MGKVFQIPNGTNKNPLTYLILSDVHDEHCDVPALLTTLKCFDLIPKKQRRIILLGDILDIGFAYNKNPETMVSLKYKDFDGYFVPEMDRAIIWFEEFYDLLRKYVSKPEHIYFMEGNHEGRLKRGYFWEKIPHAYRHNFDLETALECKKRKMPFFKNNDWLKLSVNKMPPMMLTHGQKCGANPIKKHFDLAHASVIFGHTHEIGIRSFTNVEHTIIGYNNPCLCLEEKATYLENKVTNWSVGFSLISTDQNHFFTEIHNIWNGEIIFHGQKIKS